MEGEADVLLRVGRQKAGGKARHEIHPQRPQQAQADHALAPAHPAQGVHPVVQGVQRLLGAGQKLLTEMGQRHVPAPFFKQGHPQLALHLGDGVAETGLCDAQLFRRPGVMLGVGQLHKVPQMQQIHTVVPPFSCTKYTTNHKRNLWFLWKNLIC